MDFLDVSQDARFVVAESLLREIGANFGILVDFHVPIRARLLETHSAFLKKRAVGHGGAPRDVVSFFAFDVGALDASYDGRTDGGIVVGHANEGRAL